MSITLIKWKRKVTTTLTKGRVEKPPQHPSPFNNLPPEIIIHIAQFYVCPWCDPSDPSPSGWLDQGRYTTKPSRSQHAEYYQSRISCFPSENTNPFTLCHISSRIRSVVLGTPSLWSYLSIRNIQHKGVRLLRLWLNHLKGAPLHLDLYLDYPYTSRGDILKYAKEAVRMLLDKSAQWRSARIELYRILTFAPLFRALPTRGLRGAQPAHNPTEGQDPNRSDSTLRQEPPSPAISQTSTLSFLSQDQPPSSPFPNLTSLHLIMKQSEWGVEPASWLQIYHSLIAAPAITHLLWENKHADQLPALSLAESSPFFFPAPSDPSVPLKYNRWSTLVELTLIHPIRGDQAFDILEEAINLETFAPLGGLQAVLHHLFVPPPPMQTPHTSQWSWSPPVAGRFPNIFPTGRILEAKSLKKLVLASGLRDLSSASRVLSFAALFGVVKFPGLKVVELRIGDGDALSMVPQPHALSKVTIGREKGRRSPTKTWVTPYHADQVHTNHEENAEGDQTRANLSPLPIPQHVWETILSPLFMGNEFTLSSFMLTIPHDGMLDVHGEVYISRIMADPRMETPQAFSLKRWVPAAEFPRNPKN